MLWLLAGIFSLFSNAPAADFTPFMPQVRDTTEMWWADGFPSHSPEARWLRVIQTGHYAMALDTANLTIPHFGGLTGPRADWTALPPADLALSITVDGTLYRARSGAPWTRFGGPRLIESGRFFQRADVTNLTFTDDAGNELNVEARFETAAWADRLGLIFAARPGMLPITPGEGSFGRVLGGYGLDGTNLLEIPAADFPESEHFTLECWAFLPNDFRVSEKTHPWLVCKNAHELADGNFGIVLNQNAVPEARLNLGGDQSNAFVATDPGKRPLKLDEWNHLAISYDGQFLRLYANGNIIAEESIGRTRMPRPGSLAIGGRQDKFGDGYRYRGVIDEVRLYDRALTLGELRQHWNQPEAVSAAPLPLLERTFATDGTASMTQPRSQWSDPILDLRLSTPQESRQAVHQVASSPPSADWREVSLSLDPARFSMAPTTTALTITASEIVTGIPRPVAYDPAPGWHRINLDGIEPLLPPDRSLPAHADARNDVIERVRLRLTNPTGEEQIARLLFEKTSSGFRQRVGSAITGISAMLRDTNGVPTGIPVQLSKNWHQEPAGGVYTGTWFHGFSQMRLPPGADLELELTMAYGHWGGIAAASHAQLCLIGWGSNQLWDQSALGSWGESICYEPDQVQRRCSIMDVRPLMVVGNDQSKMWGWTNNVGGGDCFALFDADDRQIPRTAMRTVYHRQGPCLTEVTYAGRLGQNITHSLTTSLGRTDDLVRATYRLRLDVSEPTDIARLVFFQIGADTYNSAAAAKMAMGNETGLVKEWSTQSGGNTYRTEPMECTGRIPWVSLHETALLGDHAGAGANRGLVIRAWNARLGGKAAAPWVAERGLRYGGKDSSTIDLVPPPGVTRLEPGDYVEAIVEHLIVPQFAKEYYGPNEALREALQKHENTWRMIHREATGNSRLVTMTRGELIEASPAIRIRTEQGRASFTFTGGLGYVPITFEGLTSPDAFRLSRDGVSLDQSIHGADFWQTDYDATTGAWSISVNVPGDEGTAHLYEFIQDE